MAYNHVDPIPLVPTPAAASSYAVDVSGLDVAADDYILILLACSATSGTISETSGGGTTWTLQTLYVASGQRMVAAYAKVAAGPTISNPTFTLSAGSGLWGGCVRVLRDVDTSTFLAGSVATVDPGAAATSATTGAMTPSSDDAMVVYFAASRLSGLGSFLRFLPSDVVGEVTQAFDDGSIFMCYGAGTVQQGAAAATAETFYASASSRIGGMVIPIKNKTSGKLQKHGVAGITKAAWLGTFVIHDTTLSFGAPDNGGVTWDGAGAINGITVSGTGATVTTDNVGPHPWGTFHGFASTLNTAGAWVGSKGTFSAAINMTGKLFATEFYFTLLGVLFGAEGAILAFKDSSGNWAAFQLCQKLGAVGGGVLYLPVIDVENATPYASGGAINWADITSITPLYHRVGSSAGTRSIFLRNWNLLSASTMTGGNSAKPLDITYLDKVLNGWGFSKLCELQGDAVLVKSDVQIGDGTKATYYDATATLTNFPEAYDSLLQREINIPANQLEIRIKAASGDTINDISSATAGPVEQDWIIDSTSSGSATYGVSGKSFVNVNPTLLAGETFTGGTWSGCAPLNTKGANLSTFTVSNTTAGASEAAVVVDTTGSTLSGGTIDVTGTGAAYHLEVGNGGTGDFAITLTNNTFTGTPGTDKVHVTNTSGTTTISISGTTTLAAGDVTTAGATVSIVSDPVYQSVIVSGQTAGSRIQIYDTTNAVELFNGTASSGDTVVSGTTATWTDPTAAAGNRAIRVRVAYVSGATAKDFLELTGLTAGTTSVTASITYPVTQVADTTYDDNAIDGSTVTGVTFTDSSPDVVNIDVASNAITWPSIYAAWVYYAFTSTGIATDIDYIDGIDTANYLLSNMKIKNTSSPTEPLVVSGGYGRDATTGASVDLVDTTGGTLIFAPDHVVSYAVGSGVTSQDKTDIATAVLSAAASSPIASNIKKVNDLTVDGTGTEVDPWGPV